MNKVENRNAAARAKPNSLDHLSPAEQEFIDIKMLSFFTSMSERMIFNLIKDPGFPKLKIGRRLLFSKKAVMEYLVKRYGNW